MSEIKKIKIFLASSSDLIEDRIDFDLALQNKNDKLDKKGLYIDLIVWENFLDHIFDKGTQNEYNKSILDCDIFVMLFFTKVGKFTFEEFTIAHNSFLETGKPTIFTYFKDAPIDSGDIDESDIQSMFEFKKKLKEIKHYIPEYNNSDDLIDHFWQQLVEMGIVPRDPWFNPWQTKYIIPAISVIALVVAWILWS